MKNMDFICAFIRDFVYQICAMKKKDLIYFAKKYL